MTWSWAAESVSGMMFRRRTRPSEGAHQQRMYRKLHPCRAHVNRACGKELLGRKAMPGLAEMANQNSGRKPELQAADVRLKPCCKFEADNRAAARWHGCDSSLKK